MPQLQDIGERVKDARLLARLSQSELARRAEVGAGTIGRLERGEHPPNTATLVRIAEALDLSAAALLDDRVPA